MKNQYVNYDFHFHFQSLDFHSKILSVVSVYISRELKTGRNIQ